LLHGLVIGLAADRSPARASGVRPLGSPQAPIELEIEVALQPVPSDEASRAVAERVASLAPQRRDGRQASVQEPDPAPFPAPEPAPEPASTTPEPTARRPTLREIGVGAPPPFRLIAPERAPSRRRALAARVDQMLTEGLAERDFARGRGAHGAVVSALQKASLSANTPERGSALFVARIEQGRVRIHVLEATQDLESWRAAAQRAMRALAGRKLRLPAGARGLEVTIRVTSNVELPSGADPGLEVRAFGIPVQKGAGKKSARLEILTPRLDVGTTQVPNPGGGEPIEVPTLELGLNVLGLHGDPSDIGATARRMVRARVESQKVLPKLPAER
jgi:hypothetical protein